MEKNNKNSLKNYAPIYKFKGKAKKNLLKFTLVYPIFDRLCHSAPKIQDSKHSQAFKILKLRLKS